MHIENVFILMPSKSVKRVFMLFLYIVLVLLLQNSFMSTVQASEGHIEEYKKEINRSKVWIFKTENVDTSKNIESPKKVIQKFEWSRPSKKIYRRARSLKMRTQVLKTRCNQDKNQDINQDFTDCVNPLENFYRSLKSNLETDSRARIVVLGNSLIASDHIVDIWRQRFVERFGDGGRGFVLLDRMAKYGRRNRAAQRAKGYATFNIAMGKRGRFEHGLAGVLHTPRRQKCFSMWRLQGEQKACLFLNHSENLKYEMIADGEHLDAIVNKISPLQTQIEFLIPEGKKKLTFRVLENDKRHPVAFYGIALEKESGGFILDTIGVPAVDSSVYLSENEELFKHQIQKLQPNLVTVMLGGNEIKRVAWGKSSLKKVRRGLEDLVKRIKLTLPQSSCLVIGPLENVRGKNSSTPFKARWQTYSVNKIHREVALQQGCAYLDLYKATGSKGSMKRLNDRRMLHDDLVHPKRHGLDAIGEVIARSVMQDFDKWLANEQKVEQ